MKYKLKCKCGATAWVPGEYDPETNATEFNDKVAWEWDCGACNGLGMIQTTSGQVDERYQQQCVACGGTGYAKGCEHPDTDFEIVDEQDDYDPEDYL